MLLLPLRLLPSVQKSGRCGRVSALCIYTKGVHSHFLFFWCQIYNFQKLNNKIKFVWLMVFVSGDTICTMLCKYVSSLPHGIVLWMSSYILNFVAWFLLATFFFALTKLVIYFLSQLRLREKWKHSTLQFTMRLKRCWTPGLQMMGVDLEV